MILMVISTKEERAIRRKEAKAVYKAKVIAKMGTRLKKCAGCGEKKVRTDFPLHSGSSDGFASYCKSCKNDMHSKRRKDRPEFRLKHHMATRVIKQLKDAEAATASNRSNPAQERSDSTPQPLRSITRDLELYLGYSIKALCRHLESDLQDRDGITLKESFNRDYHLDHIYPLSKFDVKLPTDQSFRDCWAMDNLKMIPAAENIAKSDKVSEELGNQLNDVN